MAYWPIPSVRRARKESWYLHSSSRTFVLTNTSYHDSLQVLLRDLTIADLGTVSVQIFQLHAEI